MKFALLIAFALVSLSLRAQEKEIDSFLGIKFGATKAEVLRAMTARGSILDTKENTPDIQQYKNVKLGFRKVDLFSVRFVNDKVFQADFYFLAPLEAQTIEFYDKIVEDVNDVYGKGNAYKTFKTPYEDGDGYELTAIKTGKATYRTYWTRKNTIVAEIVPAMAVKLQYQDSELVNIAIEKQKQAQKSDF
jgi:hypothetical protein